MSYPVALGVDPGLAHFGWALVRLGPSLAIEGMGVIKTQKSDAKAHVFQADDNLRRARELASRLLALLAPHLGDLKIVCAETMSHPMFKDRVTGQRNVMASVSSQMSMAWGILALLAEEWDLPIVQASPQAIKKALCGVSSASKEQVQGALDIQFGLGKKTVVLGELHLKPNKVPKGQWEHPYDALAAVVALQAADAFRAVRGHAL